MIYAHPDAVITKAMRQVCAKERIGPSRVEYNVWALVREIAYRGQSAGDIKELRTVAHQVILHGWQRRLADQLHHAQSDSFARLVERAMPLVEADRRFKTALAPSLTKSDGSLARTFVFHGTSKYSLQEIVRCGGLVAREDRDGNSVTTSATRAGEWGSWKSDSDAPIVLRISTTTITRWMWENAAPAAPTVDFTVDPFVSLEHLQVEVGCWIPLREAWQAERRPLGWH